jgi:hypothetical protein
MTTQKPFGSILTPDDLRVGAYVAVHSAAAAPRTCPEEPERRMAGRPRREGPPLSFGIPLQIRAISLPFLVCAVLRSGGGHIGPVILDLRGVRLIAVSRQFVRAIAGFKQPNTDGDENVGARRSRPTADAEAADHPA